MAQARYGNPSFVSTARSDSRGRRAGHVTMYSAPANIGSALRQFACPQEPWNDRILSIIISAAAGRVLSQFLDRYETNLRASSTGLAELLRSVLTNIAISKP